MACACIQAMNARLAEQNGRLVTTLFGTPRVVIGSEKIDSKKRGRPPAAIASFCPFCGTAYDPPTPAQPPSPISPVTPPRTPEDGLRPSTPEGGSPVTTR